MNIIYDEARRIFKLDTANTTYLIGLTREGYVGHIYYGKRLTHACGAYRLRTEERPFTPATNQRDKSAFLDCFPGEYPTGGIGDYRESCLDVRNAQGCVGAELFYHSHTIEKGKPSLPGLPASFGSPEEVETLRILCQDPVLGFRWSSCIPYFPLRTSLPEVCGFSIRGRRPCG